MAKSDKTDNPKNAKAKEDVEASDIIDAEVVAEEPSDTDQDNDETLTEDSPIEAEDLPADDNSEAQESQVEPEVPAEVSEEKPSSGAMPMVLGGVLAAAVGFAAASYLGSQGILFGSKTNDAVAELTQKLGEQDAQIKALQSVQEKTAATARAASEAVASAAESNARAEALSERVEDLGDKLVTLEGRVLEAEQRPMTEGVSSSAIEAYEREVEKLRSLVSEQLAEAESLKENSTRTAQETLAQAALTRVISALDSGVPYRGPMTELAGATGVSMPEELAAHADTGVPTMLSLAEEFPGYARAALADARQQEKGEGRVSLGHFLKTQLGARSTEPKEGDDADAILSRAEAAMREGRLPASLQELTGLPESSQAAMADWVASAEIRVAAMQAVDTLAQSLNSN